MSSQFLIQKLKSFLVPFSFGKTLLTCLTHSSQSFHTVSRNNTERERDILTSSWYTYRLQLPFTYYSLPRQGNIYTYNCSNRSSKLNGFYNNGHKYIFLESFKILSTLVVNGSWDTFGITSLDMVSLTFCFSWIPVNQRYRKTIVIQI